MEYTKEAGFFHAIAKQLLASVDHKNATVVEHKETMGDYSTNVDIETEKTIVAAINELFSDDEILAEEGFSGTSIGDGRIWIIDPICGTANLSRGISSYVTNIALAVKGEVVASCVVDYSDQTYYWSVGDGVYQEDKKYTKPENDKSLTLVDVDFGAVHHLSDAQTDNYVAAVDKLLKKEGWMLTSMNSSISFLYVALGKVDAVVNVYNHAWDIAAAMFLVRQMGGVATDLGGNEMTLTSANALMALNNDLHQALLKAYPEKTHIR